MLRTESRNNDGCFRCVKISLLVLHITALVIATVMILIFMAALIIASSHEDANKEDQNKFQAVGIFAGFLFSFMFIYELIAIIGIIKENKTIVTTYLVLSVIGLVVNMLYGTQIGLITIVVISLTAYYAVMISRKGTDSVEK